MRSDVTSIHKGHGMKQTEDVRCECGSLLAKIRDGKVELKCRRCRRVVGLAVLVDSQEFSQCSCR